MKTIVVWDQFDYDGGNRSCIESTIGFQDAWDIVAACEYGKPVGSFRAVEWKTDESTMSLDAWCQVHLSNDVEGIWNQEHRESFRKQRSDARVRAMELGLSPWPSASGWAPMDLPWKERRILIGIVEGIASLSRWAHEIWLRDHPTSDSGDCCPCGDPGCAA